MRILAILLIVAFWYLISGCQYDASPWESNVTYKDLTRKHLERLGNPDEQPFTMAITGDPQAVVGYLDSVIMRADNSSAEFLVVLGDLTDLGLKREWEFIGESLSKARKPVLTVVGNHDGLTKGKKIYPKMFGPYNYTFNYRGIKFVAWNNNSYEYHVDLEWLKRETYIDQKVVILAHQPPRSGTLSAEVEEIWEEIRQQDNVIASLHGHLHNFGYKKEGNTEIVTADRVTGTHYSLVRFEDESITVKRCTPECDTVN